MTDPATEKKVIVDIVNNPVRYRDLLTRGWRESPHPETRPTGPASALELTRRELGGKWETAWKIHDSLLARSLYRPRLDLDLISREGGAITRDDEKVHVVVVTTLVARADVDLFGLVESEFTKLNVVQTRLRANT